MSALSRSQIVLVLFERPMKSAGSSDMEELVAKGETADPQNRGPWEWIFRVFTLQNRDWLAYLAVISSIWTLSARIQDLKKNPDHAAAVGSIILLAGVAILAWAEILQVSKTWASTSPITSRWLPVPKTIAIGLAALAVIVEFVFYDSEQRMSSFLGTVFLLSFVGLGCLLYKRIKHEWGMDSSTVLAFAYAALILGCGFSLALMMIITSILVNGLAYFERLQIAIESKRQNRRVRYPFPNLMKWTPPAIAPILLATCLLSLPAAKLVAPWWRNIFEQDEVRSTGAAIRDLAKNGFKGPEIDPNTRIHLSSYYSQHNPNLLATELFFSKQGEGLGYRDQGTRFVFVTRREAPGK